MSTIYVSSSGAARGGGQWPNKAPGTKVARNLDVSAFAPVAAVQAAHVVASPPDASIALLALSVTGSVVTLIIAGGAPLTQYILAWSVEFSDASRLDIETPIYVDATPMADAPSWAPSWQVYLGEPVAPPTSPYPTSPAGLPLWSRWLDGDLLRVVTPGEN